MACKKENSYMQLAFHIIIKLNGSCKKCASGGNTYSFIEIESAQYNVILWLEHKRNLNA